LSVFSLGSKQWIQTQTRTNNPDQVFPKIQRKMMIPSQTISKKKQFENYQANFYIINESKMSSGHFKQKKFLFSICLTSKIPQIHKE